MIYSFPYMAAGACIKENLSLPSEHKPSATTFIWP